MDNFYNLVKLSKKLLERKIHTVGTLCSFRGEPPEIRKPENLVSHELLAKDNGKVVVMVYETEDRNPKAPVDNPIDRLCGGFKFHRLDISVQQNILRDTAGFATERKLTDNKI